ncbi:cytochrome c biogenesis CcdA family protein [Microbacterium panaciterrae]|uniref:Cytochrome c biogenesis protein CcdA n=1 Tax=Microbacterium panaciterrae TaxID=985759 RepID=A0ABP8PMS5_9MICO
MTGGAVAYAFVLGMIGLLNPCGFPLLPVYLTAFIDTTQDGWTRRSLAAMRAGAALTIGFLAVFGVAAAAIASIHGLIDASAPWVMLVVSTAIIVLGVLGLCGKMISVLSVPRFRAGTAFFAMVGFGIAYAIGSLSCSLPVFIAAVGGALTTGTTPAIVATVTAYGLGMGLFAIVAALIVSCADAAALRALRPAAAYIPRAAGGVCVAIGLYLLAFWAGRLGAPDLAAPITRVLDGFQSAASQTLEQAWLPLGAALVAVVLTVLVSAAIREHARSPAAAPAENSEERETHGIAE